MHAMVVVCGEKFWPLEERSWMLRVGLLPVLLSAAGWRVERLGR